MYLGGCAVEGCGGDLNSKDICMKCGEQHYPVKFKMKFNLMAKEPRLSCKIEDLQGDTLK